MNKKVTELTEASEIKSNDLLMIIQNGENKKIQYKQLEEHKYTQILTANLATQEITLPCKYKVGINVLDVYCNGIKLIKANTEDTEGHYYEVGEQNSISNTIKLSTDWYNDAEQRPTVGDVFEFVIRGEYQ